MKSPIIIASAAILGIVLSSCTPIAGPQPRQGLDQPTPEEIAAQERERERLARAEAELLRQQQQFQNPNFNNSNDNSTPTGPTDYPFASKVPGKAGFVFSPYNKQVVDVRDIPSGTLVQDPTYPASEKKYFRVP
ncbi:MAG: hypothetical protein ACO3SO_04795 [Luteolibacter sp.]